MQIEFSKEQYKTLLKLVYLGNWMANAHRTEDFEEDMEKLEHYIFSFAKDFGFEKYVDSENVGDGEFYPTRKFEEKSGVYDLHEDYDEENFWEEIISRLGERDCIRKYGAENIKKMSRMEWFEKLSDCEQEWADEMEKYGVNRLEVKK